jgi:hypothetical protein
MRHPIPRPSAAMFVACLALLVALGGTSYATVLSVPTNSVGTPELKRRAVTAEKIAQNAVRSLHVANGTLGAADFQPGQLPRATEGVSAVSTSPFPPIPPVLTNQHTGLALNLDAAFTTSRDGKLLLILNFWAELRCATSPTRWWWLTLDGSVVRSSVSFVVSAESLTLTAITAQSVPAGSHTLGVGAMCFEGETMGSSVVSRSAGSVLVLAS